jgi:carboxylesterase
LKVLHGAEPFFWPAGKKGVLLIHGFTGSPSEMRLLGEHLHKAEYTVLAPRLCGHGTTPEDMASTSWNHWYGSVLDAYHLLTAMCNEIIVIGLSMGGLLALELAVNQQVSKVVSLSAPIYLAEKRLPWLPLAALFTNFIPKRRKAIAGLDSRYSVCYKLTPLQSVKSLLKLIKHVRGQLSHMAQPLLIIQSRAEKTVVPASAQFIYDHVLTDCKKLVWLEKSGHLVTLDSERETVFAEIDQFLLETD